MVNELPMSEIKIEGQLGAVARLLFFGPRVESTSNAAMLDVLYRIGRDEIIASWWCGWIRCSAPDEAAALCPCGRGRTGYDSGDEHDNTPKCICVRATDARGGIYPNGECPKHGKSHGGGMSGHDAC